MHDEKTGWHGMLGRVLTPERTDMTCGGGERGERGEKGERGREREREREREIWLAL